MTVLAGAALCALLAVGAIRRDLLPVDEAVAGYTASFFAITVGVLVWQRRPESRTGILLTTFGFATALPDLRIVFYASALAVTIGWATIELIVPVFGHLVLSYPSGRLTSRLERWPVVFAYAYAGVYALVMLLFYSPSAPQDRFVLVCPSCVDPLTHVTWLSVLGIRDALDVGIAVLGVVFLALVARKIFRATTRQREVVLPLVTAATFVAAQFVLQIAIFGAQVDSWTNGTWFWIVTATTLVVPSALAAGLLWGRTARSAVADLVLELERTPPISVRDALARALRDPGLELVLWLPERKSFVDGDGRQVEPLADSERAVTVLGSPEAPLAALIHDPALLERRALLDAAGAAARLALENERLQAELRVQLVEVRASRARLMEAGDQERRRLERDLHDGAQQRLLGLGLALQLARTQLGPEAHGAADLLAEADNELRAALDELRELARGIHPAVLTEQGLGPALQTLAERSTVPVRIGALPSERLATTIEAAVYFLVSEGLTNVAKHACATAVDVSVACDNGTVTVDLEDNGVGGADASQGSGLRGLADRVQAVGGHVSVRSARGSGTQIHAEIPCA